MLNPWEDCYYDHFERYFGQPIARQTFQRDETSPLIQILAYEKVFREAVVFCSFGLSHFAPELKAVGEVYIAVDNALDDIPYLLANALFYMVDRQMSLGWGISIGGMENLKPDFAQYFGKTALYITNPIGLPQEFSRVTCQAEVGRMYSAVPISAAERAVFREKGAVYLEGLFEQADIDPIHLLRPSVV